jgi:uncharacterized protein YndB with AHSA1/START domain
MELQNRVLRRGLQSAALASSPRARLHNAPVTIDVGMSSRRTTRVSRVMRASRERVYSALVDADEVARWRFPTGMSIVVDQFEPREGGRVRVSLTYTSSGVGKTENGTDTYRGRFVELVPNERVVEMDEFETDDPSLQGQMRMTISLEDVAEGTAVVGLQEGIPVGCVSSVRAPDSRVGSASRPR